MRELTPVHKFGAWYAKREDLACYSGLEYPSGAKVRQYRKMAENAPKGAAMVVGCAANSAMQVYAAAAAKQARVPCHIATAARKVMTPPTAYAVRMGATVEEVRPGYMSVVRARARNFPGVKVRWDPMLALEDTAAEVANISASVKRIIVPTGSGLTVAGVLVGLARLGRFGITVVAVCVSGLAKKEKILQVAHGAAWLPGAFQPMPLLEIEQSPMKYDRAFLAHLPNGTPLDPFYAAKAYRGFETGDCFWIPGLRPISAMPEVCQRAFAHITEIK